MCEIVRPGDRLLFVAPATPADNLTEITEQITELFPGVLFATVCGPIAGGGGLRLVAHYRPDTPARPAPVDKAWLDE